MSLRNAWNWLFPPQEKSDSSYLGIIQAKPKPAPKLVRMVCKKQLIPTVLPNMDDDQRAQLNKLIVESFNKQRDESISRMIMGPQKPIIYGDSFIPVLKVPSSIFLADCTP